MKKVLIIEDDPITGKIYRQKFEMEGFRVDVAGDGQAGLQKLSEFQPDLVLLDLMLPKVNGVEVLRRIRQEAIYQELPILVFSNAYLANMVTEAWEAGATKILTKVNHTPKQVVDEARTLMGAEASPRAGAYTDQIPVAAPAPPTPPKPVRQTVSPAPVSFQDADADFEADLRRSFFQTLPAAINELRQLLQALAKSPGDLILLHEIFRKVHSLAGTSGQAYLRRISHFCAAMEAFIKSLYQKPEHINQSTLRTLAQAIDFLSRMGTAGNLAENPSAQLNILVVDDDEISRRAVGYALEKAGLKSIAVDNSQTALKMLGENRFELIILDIDMPEISGFELCTRLRMMAVHKKTPVIFLTGVTSPQAHARSVVSGGNDFITKPFLYMELALKALILLIKDQLDASDPGVNSGFTGAGPRPGMD
jgi:DNA-binding response OmpR family regulator